jgi:uncharacterized protein YyaL (SSP411 family)
MTAPHAPSPQRQNPNRLIHETSPYLLQHAFNPVDWHPWGDEALSLAKELDRPIFLSIGYSACHWCHVMEHESFENPAIARLMNEHFVCIKVDREERPDLDQIYMTAVQMLTRRGGWPMSVFLTPNQQPFFGGTYWPPESRMGMPGFRDVLLAVQRAWSDRRDDVFRSANEISSALVESATNSLPRSPLSIDLFQNAVQQLKRATDWQHGGFGGAPKFPHPMDLRVLLRGWRRFDDQEALDAVCLTLDKMIHGGIYDQLGGGFHRYSTDAHWLVPHFEKMLYDNALLVSALLEAYQATGNEEYARVVRETLDYVLREMTQPEGGFYSTQDADSEGREGKFFVWSAEEVLKVLGPDEGKAFCYAYDVTNDGNWEGTNILHRPKPHAVAAQVLKMDAWSLADLLKRCRDKLFAVRSQRVPPGRDDKVLVSWNGLMISAMSQAACVLGEERYLAAARAAADFILSKMKSVDGRLRHSYKDGRARFDAYLDDYACFIDGLIDLSQATFDPRWLQAASDLCQQMCSLFEDRSEGGFFFTANDHEQLLARMKDTQDNATPSGTGVAAYLLARLGTILGQPELTHLATKTLESMSGQLARFAMASGQALLALDFVLGPSLQVTVCPASDVQHSEGSNADDEVRAVRSEFFRRFWPNAVIRRGDSNAGDLATSSHNRSTSSEKPPTEITVVACETGTCLPPIVGLERWKDFARSRSSRAEAQQTRSTWTTQPHSP